MKNIYNTLGMTKACLCALAISLVTTGCSDLLDKEPPSAISDGSFWTGEGDAMLALTGCYRFQTGWSHDDLLRHKGCFIWILQVEMEQKRKIFLL